MTPTTFTLADLHRLLGQLYPMPLRERYRVTGHAVHRAQQRWLEPTPHAAEDAIWHVLKHGQIKAAPEGTGCFHIACGTRTCVVLLDGAVVTIWIRGAQLTERNRKLARRDHEEKRGKWTH